MSSLKQYKAAEKSLAQQKELVGELQVLVTDIERCEKTISDLRSELEIVNQQHQERKTTREDIAYLEALLKCAHKKLAWETGWRMKSCGALASTRARPAARLKARR